MPVCPEPGCPNITKRGRCQAHRRYSPTYEQRDHAERKRRERAVSAWVREHGYVCPGWAPSGHAPHPCIDLTAQHEIAVVFDGVASPLSILCRSENSRLQHRFG